MTLQELYAKYGELLVSKEILDSQILAVKQQLATELNKPKDEVKPA